jgi:hypothetical protein
MVCLLSRPLQCGACAPRNTDVKRLNDPAPILNVRGIETGIAGVAASIVAGAAASLLARAVASVAAAVRSVAAPCLQTPATLPRKLPPRKLPPGKFPSLRALLVCPRREECRSSAEFPWTENKGCSEEGEMFLVSAGTRACGGCDTQRVDLYGSAVVKKPREWKTFLEQFNAFSSDYLGFRGHLIEDAFHRPSADQTDP